MKDCVHGVSELVSWVVSYKCFVPLHGNYIPDNYEVLVNHTLLINHE